MNNKYIEDAKQIKEALNDSSIDEKALINIVTKRTHKERMKIRRAYKESFNRDLMSDLNSELYSNFKLTMLALFTDPVEYDVDSIYKSLKSKEVDKDTLIEIFASRPWWYLNKIKEIYEKKYKINLEEELTKDSSDDFKIILALLLKNERSTNTEPDHDECEQIAIKLNDIKKLSIDEPIIQKLFCSYSPQELISISREYHKITGITLTKAIENSFREVDIKKLLKSILFALISPSEYFANRMHEALDETCPNENIITRILVSRGPVDLIIIKKYYYELYNMNMVEDIKKCLKDAYQILCVELCNKE